jgi:integration host factor subunit beta
LNKSDLIEALGAKAHLPNKRAEFIVNHIFDLMTAAMARGERIEIRGFGSFQVKSYKGYKGRNPKTGQAIAVPEKKLPFFKTGKELKERVDRPLSAPPAENQVDDQQKPQVE